MTTSSIIGIFQSDIIIRSAIIAGLADLRLNPRLLDFAFASLAKDELTLREYGTREIAAAKKWFASTEIPVFMNTRIDEAKLPCISIGLEDSTEAETTLADVAWEVREDSDLDWPSLSEAFEPLSYNALTGVMTIPEEIGDALVLGPGMVLLDSTGRSHPIVSVTDRYTIELAKGLVANFAATVIKGARPSSITQIESLQMKETYTIGCHVQGEQTQLTYLHSILTFIMLRYKETLLEARGFERSVFQSTDFRRNDSFEAELVFSRHMQVTGYVRQSWPKATHPKITALSLSPLKISDSGKLPADTDVDDATWIGDQDALTVKIK